jgi:hypothetical protein
MLCPPYTNSAIALHARKPDRLIFVSRFSSSSAAISTTDGCSPILSANLNNGDDRTSSVDGFADLDFHC